MRYLFLPLVALFLSLLVNAPVLAQTMAAYTSFPPVMESSAKAGALILLSNQNTLFTEGYREAYDDSLDYYGYFDPKKSYDYGNWFTPYQVNTSTTDHYAPAGKWSGNFLNWLTMSHVDFLRKAVTGGFRKVDSVAQTTLGRADIITKTHFWVKTYAGADLGRLTPYNAPALTFTNSGTTFSIALGRRPPSFNVEVEVCNMAFPEANCKGYPPNAVTPTNYKPEGLLQAYRSKINFGLMAYSADKEGVGGLVRSNLMDVGEEYGFDTNGQKNQKQGVMYDLNEFKEQTKDPLGEMYFEALRYYKGLTNLTGGATLDFCPPPGANDDKLPVKGCPTKTDWTDPIETWCQKNSIIILNDEYPSADGESVAGSPFSNFPSADFDINASALTKAVGDAEGITGTSRYVGNIRGGLLDDDCGTTKFIDDLSQVSGICPYEPAQKGTFLLAGLAHYAMTEDIRPAGSPGEMPEDQHVRTYVVAYRATENDTSVDADGDSLPDGYKSPPFEMGPLWLAAKYGNFDDQNGNKLPDLVEEWDGFWGDKPDGQPDGLFYAESGDSIEKALNKVLDGILKRSASGTSVSVLSTSGEGQGNLVQAYYRPLQTILGMDIKWSGYLQSLWVDEKGFIREDTNLNHSLDIASDKVVRYFVDTDGMTRIMRFDVTSVRPFPDVLNDSFDVIELNEVAVVWEGGTRLAQRTADSRHIFTFLDKDNDQSVDASEVVDLDVSSVSDIQPFLGLQTDLFLGTTEANRAANLIQYIRGNDPILDASAFVDSPELRNRAIDGQTWKLGDIIHSTPVAISTPIDNFGVIYGDQTYQAFYNMYKDRETTVYVGANDGMLHAFTSWQFDPTAKEYVKPAVAPAAEQIGDELWAFVPQSLLPHLKWLPKQDYTHVYYMDLQPKLVDARIFPDDAIHPSGWGTVLIAGMNMGGGSIYVDGAFDGGTTERRFFHPSYVAMDVTDPRNPRLLWERSFAGLNHSTSFPAVIRVEDSNGITDKGIWYATFGSGPETYNGTSTTNGHIYVVDLLTGRPYRSGTNDWRFQTTETKAFMGSAASIDMGLNYNVDAFYVGQTYDSSNNATPSWRGSMYKVRIPWSGTSSVYGSIIEGDQNNGSYNSDPSTWRLVRLFDSPRPITAAPSLSLDLYQNTWVYFGTGRYFNLTANGDKQSTDTEYLYGIKDPFFNYQHQPGGTFGDSYYHNDLGSLTLDPTDLFNADLYSVLENGTVLTGGPATYTTWGNFDMLKRAARLTDGWRRTLPVSATAERSLTKPAVIGGVSLFTTFTPVADLCSFGGNSYLYALYYETGTAYEDSIFKSVTQETVDGVTRNVYTGATDAVTVDGITQDRVIDKTDLGSGTTSSIGIHVGTQEGGEATGYVQQGTGNVIDFGFKPAFNIRSGIRSWRIAEPKIP
jgi:type IV pilus assembly protein PilY1